MGRIKEEMIGLTHNVECAIACWYGIPMDDRDRIEREVRDAFGCGLCEFMAETGDFARVADFVRDLRNDARDEAHGRSAELFDAELFHDRFRDAEYTRLVSCVLACAHALESPLLAGL